MATQMTKLLHPQSLKDSDVVHVSHPAQEEEVLFVTVFKRAGSVLPITLISSLAAVLIGKYGYHLSGGHLVLGASVPLMSLFVISRIAVALSPYQTQKKTPRRRASLLGLVSMGVSFLALLIAATFGLSALMFYALRVPDAAREALVATNICSAVFAIGFLGSVAIAFREKAWHHMRPQIMRTLLEVVSCFLYLPTLLLLVLNPRHPINLGGSDTLEDRR